MNKEEKELKGLCTIVVAESSRGELLKFITDFPGKFSELLRIFSLTPTTISEVGEGEFYYSVLQESDFDVVEVSLYQAVLILANTVGKSLITGTLKESSKGFVTYKFEDKFLVEFPLNTNPYSKTVSTPNKIVNILQIKEPPTLDDEEITDTLNLRVKGEFNLQGEDKDKLKLDILKTIYDSLCRGVAIPLPVSEGKKPSEYYVEGDFNFCLLVILLVSKDYYIVNNSLVSKNMLYSVELNKEIIDYISVDKTFGIEEIKDLQFINNQILEANNAKQIEEIQSDSLQSYEIEPPKEGLFITDLFGSLSDETKKHVAYFPKDVTTLRIIRKILKRKEIYLNTDITKSERKLISDKKSYKAFFNKKVVYPVTIGKQTAWLGSKDILALKDWLEDVKVIKE